MRSICSLISCNFLLFACNLIKFIARFWINCFLAFGSIFSLASKNLIGPTFLLVVILLFSSFLSYEIWRHSWLSSSLKFFFFCEGIVSLLTVMFLTFSKCKVSSSGYAAFIYDSLATTRLSLMLSWLYLYLTQALPSDLWIYLLLCTCVHILNGISVYPIHR